MNILSSPVESVIENINQEIERSRVSDLEAELRRWGLFGEYEDRFLDLFRKSQDCAIILATRPGRPKGGRTYV